MTMMLGPSKAVLAGTYDDQPTGDVPVVSAEDAGTDGGQTDGDGADQAAAAGANDAAAERADQAAAAGANDAAAEREAEAAEPAAQGREAAEPAAQGRGDGE
jgi:translation initiation factor IF-3